MKLKSAISTALAVIICMTFFCGCNITELGTDNLLHPPKTLGDEAAIEQLIADTANGKYTLKYPKSGSYRSAIIMYDLDNDGTEESIAFYRKGDDTARIHMLVMYSKDNVWTLSSDNITDTTDIDCVDFADVNSDGIKEILVGTATYTTNINLLSCYSYLKGKTQSITANQQYSSFCCGDFNYDGDDEVISLLLYSADNEASASMLDYNKDKNSLYTKAEVAMDPSIVKYKNISVSKLDGNTTGVVVDGSFSNEDINTQVIYYNRELSLLRNPLYKDKTKSFTQRSLNISSADIDSDTYIEIPAVSKMPYPKDTAADEAAYRIEWFSFSEEKEAAQTKLVMIASHDLDFAFRIPNNWNTDSVSAKYETNNESLAFYEWNKDNYGEKLFDIQAFSSAVWDMGKNDDYTLITKSDNVAYAFKKYSTESSLMLSDEEIKTAFTVLNATTV